MKNIIAMLSERRELNCNWWQYWNIKCRNAVEILWSLSDRRNNLSRI